MRKKFLLKFTGVVFFILIILIIVFGGVFALTYFDILEIPAAERLLEETGLKKSEQEVSRQNEPDREAAEKGETDLQPDDYKVESIDAEEFFQKNSQIVSETNVNESENVPAEDEVTAMLHDRGFSSYPITTEYAMDGTYGKADAISGIAKVKHPMYQTYYVTENQEMWVVAVIDGDIMANPVSYNMQASPENQVMVSESESITSYDSATNKFYRCIPNQDVMVVSTVEKIDAKTLDEWTFE